jgi:hypothetical protein
LKLLTAATVIALVSAASALADTVTETEPVFAGTTFSDCTMESVVYDGKMHMTVRTSDDGSHTGAEVHIVSMTATGLVSGARYVYSNNQNESSNVSFNGATEATAEQTVILNRLGEDKTIVLGDDMRMHVSFHMTKNANGVVTVDRTDVRNECQ